MLFYHEMCRMVGTVLLWVGILTLLYYIPLALCIIAASFFLIPGSFYFIFRKSNGFIEFIRILLVLFFLLFPIYGWYRSYIGDPLVDTRAVAQKDVQEYQKKAAMKRFYDNRDFIIKGIVHYIDEGNYRFAYAHADEFMYTNDPELVRLHELAKQKMIEKGEFKETPAN